MAAAQYALGKEHGEKGHPRMYHRKRPYESLAAQRSYDRGYDDGAMNRMNAGRIARGDSPIPTRFTIRAVSR